MVQWLSHSKYTVGSSNNLLSYKSCNVLDDLGWMGVIYAGSTKVKNAKPVDLFYKAPSDVKSLQRIIFDTESQDGKGLWDCIQAHNEYSVSDEEVATFIRRLVNHLYHHIAINLSMMPLSRIGTSAVFTGSAGRIKLLCKKGVHEMLRHITETLQEKELT